MVQGRRVYTGQGSLGGTGQGRRMYRPGYTPWVHHPPATPGYPAHPVHHSRPAPWPSSRLWLPPLSLPRRPPAPSWDYLESLLGPPGSLLGPPGKPGIGPNDHLGSLESGQKTTLGDLESGQKTTLGSLGSPESDGIPSKSGKSGVKADKSGPKCADFA